MSDATPSRTPWWKGNSPYQWLVFVIAGGAWLFDNLDQRLFSLARISALADLMNAPGTDLTVQGYAKIVTAVFLIGWGIGGLTIGALGDRFGRVRLLTYSILIYAAGTGATALSQDAHHFLALRAITGFGIGGVFGLAVAIIAENFSGSKRVAMLAGLQVLSTIGNISAALVKMGIDGLAAQGLVEQSDVWRYLFAVGTLPLFLAIASAVLLKESPAWTKARDEGALPKGWLGSYVSLLKNRNERKNLFIGSMLAMSGVVGLWAIGEFAVDLQDAVFSTHYSYLGKPSAIKEHVASAKNLAYLLQMAGAAVGMMLFTWIAETIGRRPAFMMGFATAGIVTASVYWRLSTPQDAYWMMPLMGAAQMSVFAGFSIYLPELFGTTARGTGVSFCYNLGRFAAAAGGFVSATLSRDLFGHLAAPLPLRYSAMAMCCVFTLGFIAALIGPETRGQEQT